MSGVFVSYCRPSAQVAEQVASALSSLGYEVWRDEQLPAHRAYGDVIEEKLRSARAVVVLWSSEACQSQWVRAEADYARQAGTLVQASLDGTIPPLPFNQIQCADLSNWSGDGQASGWRKIEQSVAALAPLDPAPTGPRPVVNRLAICVLPFQNMSGEAEQEYFSDGISEDITTDLSKVSTLAVTARNTAFQFKGQSVDVCELANRLGVSHVLEGSVRKAGGRVRITAQLIDGTSGDHLWAERYDRDLDDIFAIQDEISKAIVDALRLKLLPSEKRAIESRGTTSPDAYDLFLMARQSWIDGDFGASGREHRVIRICQRAVELDPRYAQAWALMALAQANLRYAYMSNEALDDGLEAANRALAIDPNIAEAHLPRAWHFAMAGKDQQSRDEIETALRLNPDSWEANKEAARVYYRHGKVVEATRHLEKASAIAESDFHSRGMLSACYLAQGDWERARESAERLIDQVKEVLKRNPDNGAAIAYGALSFAAVGNLERAKEWIDRGLLLDPDNMYMRYNLAWTLLAYFKDPEAALEMLAPALAEAGSTLITLASVDRNLDQLRDDKRFQAMLREARKRVFGEER
ncbi:MAG TPA: TIR domain-containing protein [Sphingomicrobium sp.]|jgi:adenylate cyclase|nr:TIR domain-containing protein [Sphingomicrobium sp.]